MKDKKYKVIGILVVLYFVFSISYIFIKNLNITYIVFPDGNNLEFNGKWKIITNDDLPKYKYSISNNGSLLKATSLNVDGEVITYNNQELLDNAIAYRGSKVKNSSYNISTVSNDDYIFISEVLHQNDINVNTKDVEYFQKYEIDLDNDNNNEIIYTVSNNYDISIGDLFSMVLVKTISSSYLIDLKKFDNEFDSYIPYLYFIDISKDNYNDMIIKKTYSSLIGQDVLMLRFNKGIEKYETIYKEVVQ